MQNTLIELMRPMYHTFVDFTSMTFDETSASSLFDAIAGTGETTDTDTVETMRNRFQDIRMDAAREAIILDGFINRYENCVMSEKDTMKILGILQESIKFAERVYEQLQYAKNKSAYDRYNRHIEIAKTINHITMVRGAIEIYNSKLIDYAEIDQLLENYPNGIVLFDSSVDNESIKNDADIIMAKLTALLIKLKDGGVKWAETILNKISSEPQTPINLGTPDDSESSVNELDQN